MRHITLSALLSLALLTSCNQGSESNSATISNDEYDLNYMTNKEFSRSDANGDGVLTVADLELIKPQSIKMTVEKFIKEVGGTVDKKAYAKLYQLPQSDVEAQITRNIQYREVDGRRMMMDLYRPMGSEDSKIPVVMFLHGGGWFAGDKYLVASGSHLKVLKQLLDGGIAVAAVNYSLVNDRDIHVEDCVSDVKDALAYLNREADTLMLDRDKMVVWGGSAGAHLTMMLGFTDLDDFPGDKSLSEYRMKPASLLSWYGAGSFEVHDSENLEAEMKDLTSFHLRFTPSSDWDVRRAKAAQVSPIRYIDSQDPSIMLMGGDKDVIVEIAQGYALRDELNKSGVENRLVVVNNAEHSWLGDDKDPDLDGICKITADYIISKIGN